MGDTTQQETAEDSHVGALAALERREAAARGPRSSASRMRKRSFSSPRLARERWGRGAGYRSPPSGRPAHPARCSEYGPRAGISGCAESAPPSAPTRGESGSALPAPDPCSARRPRRSHSTAQPLPRVIHGSLSRRHDRRPATRKPYPAKIRPGASPLVPSPPLKRQRGKNQSNVLATRNPTALYRVPVVSLPRFAERRSHGMKLHEPPRKTRQPQSPPRVHALPSTGAPR